MSNRDPRKSPAPGDVLRKGNRTRKVVPNRYPYHREAVCYESTPESSCDACLTRAGWWRWAKDAEVIKYAD